MTENKPFPVPCNECGAQISEPCRPGCPNLDDPGMEADDDDY